MKRYIRCNNTNSTLVNAIYYIIQSSLGMGEWIDESAEYLAELAGYDFDDSMDMDDVCKAALNILVDNKSSDLVQFVNYYFTEEDLIDYIIDNCVSDPNLVSAIDALYDAMGAFPGGNQVRQNVESSIFNSGVYLGLDVAEIGYSVGHTYWQYVTAEEYGVKSNNAYTVGDTISDGEYVYAFGKDISSYYFETEYPNQRIPQYVGFNFMVRSEGDGAVVDAYLNIAYSEDGSGYVQHANGDLVESWMVPNGNSDTIDKVSHDIAQWLDSNVDFAIQGGVNLYQSLNL